MREKELEFESADGLQISGTMTLPSEAVKSVTVLVHGGGGVDRHESNGYFDLFANYLASKSIASLRFDHRAYYGSIDQSIDVTLAGIANDVDAAAELLMAETGKSFVSVVGASFSGGATAIWANERAEKISSLILWFPQLDYDARVHDIKQWWNGNKLTAETISSLRKDGFIRNGFGIPTSRALLNESLLINPTRLVGSLTTPTLIVHGTQDALVPFERSQNLAKAIATGELIAINGADHGFSFPGDPKHEQRRTRELQEEAFKFTANWIDKYAN